MNIGSLALVVVVIDSFHFSLEVRFRAYAIGDSLSILQHLKLAFSTLQPCKASRFPFYIFEMRVFPFYSFRKAPFPFFILHIPPLPIV